MKAWILQNTGEDDAGDSLVWADSRNEAKKQAYVDGPYIYQKDLTPDSWTDIRAVRAAYMDEMEKESESAIMLKLMEHGWWFEIGGKRYDEGNIEEFKRDIGFALLD